MNKYIKKSLKHLNLSFESDKIKTIKDIDSELRSSNDIISEIEMTIQDCNDSIEEIKNNMALLEDVKNQAEIEEYKEMNPNAKAIYKF